MARLITDASDEELARYAAAIKAEQDRRRTLANAESQMADLNRRYLDAQGLKPGDPWRQPSGAHDSYPAGWEVTHEGKTWIADADGTAWEPGVAGWTQKVEEGEIPEWVQPQAHNPYMTGDRVRFEGDVYESIIDGNVWSPADYPQGWKRVES